MTHYISCPLCQNNDFSILHLSTLIKSDFDPKIIKNNLKNTLDDFTKHSQVVKCNHCDLVYSNPQESFSTLLSGYKDVVDEEYLKTETFRKVLLTQHLNMIERYKKSGKLLDIGCFVGYFIQLAKIKKWNAVGIEPSKWARSIAKDRGLTIIGTNIETTLLKKNTYDVITLWDVIEHLPNPRNIIKKIHGLLKSDGIVAIGTPNIESVFAKILKSKNPYLIRMHLLFFSPYTLKKLLQEEGFEVIFKTTYGRVFPLYYFFDRLGLKYKIFNSFNNYLAKIPKLKNIPITLNLRDSFTMIARKIPNNESGKKPFITIIITAYNEEETIKKIIKDTQKYTSQYTKEIIVIDDASEDNTKLIAEKSGADKVISHKKNIGKGGAFKTGIIHSKGDYIIQIDADYQFLPKEIPKLVRYLQIGYDVVLGTRYENESNIEDESVNHIRLYGSYFLSFATSFFADIHVTDVMAGFKGFKKNVFTNIDIQTNHFGYEAEVVIKAAKKKYKIINVPISYRRRMSGKSSLIPFKHGFLVLGTIIKTAFD